MDKYNILKEKCKKIMQKKQEKQGQDGKRCKTVRAGVKLDMKILGNKT